MAVILVNNQLIQRNLVWVNEKERPMLCKSSNGRFIFFQIYSPIVQVIQVGSRQKLR